MPSRRSQQIVRHPCSPLRSLLAGRLVGVFLTLVLAFVALATPALAEHPGEETTPASGADGHSKVSAMVQRSVFVQPDDDLAHNIPDLLVSVGDEEVTCDFLTHYKVTGGLARWGFATSEVIQELPGALTQYYQRGVVDCQPHDGVWQMERRLAWDYLGGGLGGSDDLGVEPDLLSEQPGMEIGPWGHRVSNVAVDGTTTGFLDFFEALGGLYTFGYPKSDARYDEDPEAALGIEDADPGLIRQYFQAAVLEYRPGDPEPVHLRFLGDDVRDVVYPFGSYKSFRSFGPAKPVYYGQTYVPEGTSFRDALVALYHSTDGANWTSNRNWLSDEPMDEWFGVTADDDGRVIELDLSQNQLNGEIPAEIGRLTDLQDLDLFGNQLRGEIPPEIGSLANVTRLALWANQLTGEVPPEFGNLASLEWVALGINELSGPIPPEIGNLSNLAEADFTLNQFSGPIPSELGNLTNMTWLVFWSNELSGEIPPELGNLTNLIRLDLDFNRLSGEIPPELGNLTNLQQLYLRVNRLSGEIPPELGNLTNLIVLGLEENQLTGDIPAEMANLTNLRWLRLTGGNEFTGCVPEVWQDVSDNDLDELDLPVCGAEDTE